MKNRPFITFLGLLLITISISASSYTGSDREHPMRGPVVINALELHKKEEFHPIVVPYPTRTIADRLLDANTIVLAKEDTEKPFTYEAHTAVKGSLTDAKEIKLFMNSVNRRLLNLFPERNCVLIRIDDGEKQVWETVGTPHPEIETLVYDILEDANSWNKDPKTRLDFFADRIQHSNSTISELSYLEIGRAPYSEIRKLRGIIPSSEIHAFLRDVQFVEWHALHILLLGLSNDPYDHKVIKDGFYAARYGTDKRLAAWAAAYIEIKPEEALAAIEREYLYTSGWELNEMKAVVMAVSAHASEGHMQLRDRIVEGYRKVLKNYPELATLVVENLMQWQRWDFVEIIDEIMNDPPPTFNYKTAFVLRLYIRAAKAKEDSLKGDH